MTLHEPLRLISQPAYLFPVATAIIRAVDLRAFYEAARRDSISIGSVGIRDLTGNLIAVHKSVEHIGLGQTEVDADPSSKFRLWKPVVYRFPCFAAIS
ncbi:hypothetical protein ES703_59864 [subsurface metagenome]